MSLLKNVTEQDVLTNFEKNINDFCEFYHLKTKTPRPQICKIMVEKFKGKVEGGKSDDWMRKRIDQKYKMAYRIKNVNQKKISRIQRLREKFERAEEELLQATNEVSTKIKQDF